MTKKWLSMVTKKNKLWNTDTEDFETYHKSPFKPVLADARNTITTNRLLAMCVQ